MEDVLTSSLMLLCAAGTRMARTGGFPSPEEPLDEGGRRDAARARLPERYRRTVIASPMRAAQETAHGMGLDAAEEPALADADAGDWQGCDLAVIAPEALAVWLADPVQGPPGGESLTAVHLRAGRWLDGIAATNDAVCAITHPTVIRALLAHALDLPLAATLRIDVAPLSRTILSFNGVWRLQALGLFD